MTELSAGMQAPAINSKDQDGNPISLDQFRGKTVVLYFYPKDDTPGCTAEACDFRDNYQQLLSKDIAVLGVSVDDEESHKKFISKHSLPFPLISDTDHKIVNDYGVWVEKNMYGKKYMGINRRTFIIDEQGVIKTVVKKVDTKNASAQVLELLSV
ncbi:thioredoxin-dependent thiol peroxidase [Pedobacter sp. SAFR-022]|jgi:peroxiredoxin Q/BCP|uniref:thioredoxin-dependent thiol peroxidase n=1 Tax=Pedobacter sp. SAFR-022 TaxID=3436861 RepID=UPI003F7F2FD7